MTKKSDNCYDIGGRMRLKYTLRQEVNECQTFHRESFG